MTFSALALLAMLAPAQADAEAPAVAAEETEATTEAAATTETAATGETEATETKEPPPEPEPVEAAAEPMPEPEAEAAPKAEPEPEPPAEVKPTAGTSCDHSKHAKHDEPHPPFVKAGLQVRPRTEKSFMGPLGVPRGVGSLRGNPNYRTTQRTRGILSFQGESVAAKLSVQDVRTWSSEMDTLADFTADSLDMHEAWVQVGGAYRIRAGRQELNLDGQRLVGAVNWTQQGRAFDALRFDYEGDHRALTLVAARNRSGGRNQDLFIAHVAFDLAGIKATVPLIIQTNELVALQNRASGNRAEWNRLTGGVYLEAGGKLFWRAEGYAQTGTDHEAFMVAGRVGYKINEMFVPQLWVDYLSGDRDHTDGQSGTFDTLFATNHKFYGFMDRFLNIPLHTAQGGLIDIALKNQGTIGPGTLHVAIHEFLLANEDTLGRSGLIGLEADVIYTIPLDKRVNLQIGAAAFMDQGDFAEERDNATLADGTTGARKIHDWFYVQLDITL